MWHNIFIHSCFPLISVWEPWNCLVVYLVVLSDAYLQKIEKLLLIHSLIYFFFTISIITLFVWFYLEVKDLNLQPFRTELIFGEWKVLNGGKLKYHLGEPQWPPQGWIPSSLFSTWMLTETHKPACLCVAPLFSRVFKYQKSEEQNKNMACFQRGVVTLGA